MLKSLYIIQDAVKQGQWQVTPKSKASHTHPHYHHKSNITFQQTYQADQDEERNQANEDHHHCWQKVEKCTEVHVTGRCKCGNDSSNSRKNPCKSLQMCVCAPVGSFHICTGKIVKEVSYHQTNSQSVLLTWPLMTAAVYFWGRIPAKPNVLLWNIPLATAWRPRSAKVPVYSNTLSF